MSKYHLDKDVKIKPKYWDKFKEDIRNGRRSNHFHGQYLINDLDLRGRVCDKMIIDLQYLHEDDFIEFVEKYFPFK